MRSIVAAAGFPAFAAFRCALAVRRRAIGACAAIGTIGWIASACGDDQDAAGARALWDRVHAEGYRGWAHPAGRPGRQASFTSHASETEVFLNATAAAAANEPGRAEWPAGTVIVKDGYDAGGELTLVAIMEKRAGGWFWAEYDASGDAKYSGEPRVCLDCHGRSTSDHTWSVRLVR